MKTTDYFDITLSNTIEGQVKSSLYSESQKFFRKTLYEDDNFQLVFIRDENINNQPYHKYEIKTKVGSLADECVVGIRIESVDKEDDGQVFYWPKSIKVNWGMSSKPASVNKMIQALTEANNFSQAVSKILSIHIAD